MVDRLVIDEKIRVRLSDSVETALRWGEGVLLTLHQVPDAESKVQSPKSKVGPQETARQQPASTHHASRITPATRPRPSAWIETLHSNRNLSPATGKSYEPLTPKHFSFNAPAGACPVCHGLGQKLVFDEGLVVPDPEKSLEQGAVLPWRRGGKRMIVYYKGLLRGVAQPLPAEPGGALQDAAGGFPARPAPGLGRDRDRVHLLARRQDEQSHAPLRRRHPQSAAALSGERKRVHPQPAQGLHEPAVLRRLPGAAAQAGDPGGDAWAMRSAGSSGAWCVVRVARPEQTQHHATHGNTQPATRNRLPPIPGLSIMDVCALSVERADEFFATLKLTEFQEKIAHDLIKEIRARLGFLKNVGLGYLTLDRESGTLSGGEAQRIRLATQIGAGLVGVLYILDEPSIGLHQRDNDRLLRTLGGPARPRQLRARGRARRRHHPPRRLHPRPRPRRRACAAANWSRRARWRRCSPIPSRSPPSTSRGELSIPVPRQRVKPSPDRGWLEVLGARENNLKNIDARIPLGTLTCVTGVSGSGKSTLVDDILRRALFRKFFGSKERPGAHRALKGFENLDKVIVIDQTPIGRTPRSNPATYTGMFNHIRDLFARLPAAKIRGYGAGRFSFNVKGGRCEKCQGDGLIKIEMHFLPPVYVTCEACNGRRYNRETLEITYKGKNIADVLDMTVDEAVTFFRAVPQIYEPLLTLAEVGLGYIGLGQSGHDAQRRRGAARQARRRAEPQGHRAHALHPRRAHHRPALPRRRQAARGALQAARHRQHPAGHRAQPGRDQDRRLDH